MENREFKVNVINAYGRKYRILWNILKKDGNTPKNSGLIFCPFHDNYNTPAAKYYLDNNAENIWCFSEHRMYDLSAYYEKLLGLNLDTVFSEIWSNLSETDKQGLTDLFGEYDIEVKPEDLPIYERFKNQQINYKELLIELINKETSQ